MPRAIWKGPWVHPAVVEEVKAVLASMLTNTYSHFVFLFVHSPLFRSHFCMYIYIYIYIYLLYLAKLPTGAYNQVSPIRTKAR